MKTTKFFIFFFLPCALISASYKSFKTTIKNCPELRLIHLLTLEDAPVQLKTYAHQMLSEITHKKFNDSKDLADVWLSTMPDKNCITPLICNAVSPQFEKNFRNSLIKHGLSSLKFLLCEDEQNKTFKQFKTIFISKPYNNFSVYHELGHLIFYYEMLKRGINRNDNYKKLIMVEEIMGLSWFNEITEAVCKGIDFLKSLPLFTEELSKYNVSLEQLHGFKQICTGRDPERWSNIVEEIYCDWFAIKFLKTLDKPTFYIHGAVDLIKNGFRNFDFNDPIHPASLERIAYLIGKSLDSLPTSEVFNAWVENLKNQILNPQLVKIEIKINQLFATIQNPLQVFSTLPLDTKIANKETVEKLIKKIDEYIKKIKNDLKILKGDLNLKVQLNKIELLFKALQKFKEIIIQMHTVLFHYLKIDENKQKVLNQSLYGLFDSIEQSKRSIEEIKACFPFSAS